MPDMNYIDRPRRWEERERGRKKDGESELRRREGREGELGWIRE